MFALSFQNQSTVVSDAALQTFIQDFQVQISTDFERAWGVNATVNAGAGGWPITITDYPGPNDPPGALGYHALDQNFNPYGVVFARLALNQGTTWTSVASHEGLEILADPLIDSACFIDTSGGQGTSGFLVNQEVCDAVERLTYLGALYQTPLSDFVFPGWFIPGYTGPVDQMGLVPGPLQLASGGYIGVDQIVGTGWAPENAAREARTLAQWMRQQQLSVQPTPARQLRISALALTSKQLVPQSV